MSKEDLMVLAEQLGIKEPGVGWPKCCPPKGNKDDIVRALENLDGGRKAAGPSGARRKSSAAQVAHLSGGLQGLAIEDVATGLFHQTNEETAKIILRTQTMKPGSSGLAGGGIYFATTKELTGHKAHAHGVILKAYVALGKILTLEADGDSGMTLNKLKGARAQFACFERCLLNAVLLAKVRVKPKTALWKVFTNESV